MATKVTQIQQTAPAEGKLPYVLVPYGLYYNNDLKKTEVGSAIDFCNGWERQRRMLVRKCKVPIDSAVFTFLCASIYGDKVGWAQLLKAWEAKAVIDGYGQEAFNTDYAYLIEVAPLGVSATEEPEESRYGKEIWRIAGEEALKEKERKKRRRGRRGADKK